jgi:hypothetical protein
VQYGTELLFNRITVGGLQVDPQTASSTDSQNEYGIQSLDLAGLLLPTGATGTADAAALANYLLSKYDEPELRFDSMTVQLAGMGTANQAAILALEITDIIRVEFRPNNIGDRIVKDVQVIGIRHNVRPDRHEVTFNLASTDTAAFVFGGGTAAADYPYSLFDSSPFGL